MQRSLRKISATTDPAAMGPLSDLVAEADRDGASSSTMHDGQVALAAVAALAKINDQAATEALLEIALLAARDDLRLAAAEALRQRRPTSYMPLLMAALRQPLEFSATTYVLPTGHVSLYETVNEEGPLSQSTEQRQSNYATHEVVTPQGIVGEAARPPCCRSPLPRKAAPTTWLSPTSILTSLAKGGWPTSQRIPR